MLLVQEDRMHGGYTANPSGQQQSNSVYSILWCVCVCVAVVLADARGKIIGLSA